MTMPKFAFLAAVALAAAVHPLSAAQREAAIRLGAEPCVSPDGRTFYFEWADSIWRAPVAGGAAVRILRDPTRGGLATTLNEFIAEVLDQKRIEFWGEGNAFPSAKRLKPGVMQNYEGTNAPSNIFKINCAGIKPNWNLVIPIRELNNNKALQGLNNPDPTQTVKGPSPVGEYAPGNN